MNLNKKRALVICHDAGGSEVVSAWVKDNSDYSFMYCLKGSAVKIFSKKINISGNLSEGEASRLIENKDIDIIFTGTSWEDKLELRLIKVANINNIRTVTFLDHWINHRERFGYPNENWLENLPSEVWCGDRYCFDICKDWGFPESKLKYVPNKYFDEIKQEALQIDINTQNNSVLYLCEPIAEHTLNEHGDELFFGYNEYTAIENFFNNLDKVIAAPKIVTIRRHPSEKAHKYDKYINQYSSKYNIHYSEGSSLVEDLMAHEKIIGCETMAMVVGVLVGKKVFTAIPIEGKPCSLPFKEIQKLY